MWKSSHYVPKELVYHINAGGVLCHHKFDGLRIRVDGDFIQGDKKGLRAGVMCTIAAPARCAHLARGRQAIDVCSFEVDRLDLLSRQSWRVMN